MWNYDRFVPKLKIINTIWTFSNGEKRFSVSTFYATQQRMYFPFTFHGSSVESGVNSNSFLEKWICIFIKVKTPSSKARERQLQQDICSVQKFRFQQQLSVHFFFRSIAGALFPNCLFYLGKTGVVIAVIILRL